MHARIVLSTDLFKITFPEFISALSGFLNIIGCINEISGVTVIGGFRFKSFLGTDLKPANVNFRSVVFWVSLPFAGGYAPPLMWQRDALAPG